jgi:hypothetical protein
VDLLCEGGPSCNILDLDSEAYEGKHVADSQCHLPQATLNKHAVEDQAEETYGTGTRDMVLVLVLV